MTHDVVPAGTTNAGAAGTDPNYPPPMERHVTAHLELEVSATIDMVLAIAVADGVPRVGETLQITCDGVALDPAPIGAPHGARLHQLRGVTPGKVVVDYRTTVVGSAAPIQVADSEWYQYIRPSRYCESDQLGPLARAEFAGLYDHALLEAVSSWVGANISYVSGSSRPTDGAVNTLLARAGVCRDFAHLTVALLRANDVPARVVSVYAPGLDPMDFHAVAEACVDEAWYVVDPTCLAPRQSLVRIATGADAADTAFLTVINGFAEFRALEVSAVVQPSLPYDDVSELVQLG
jgi:transglutaminase-like putative cysteine protease